MERLFQILAVILAGIAVFFWWEGNIDGLFVSAVFGAVCFFLSIRFQVKERIEQRSAEEEEEEEETEEEEEPPQEEPERDGQESLQDKEI